MSLRRAAHAVYDCQYHLVWTPKRRRAILQGSVGRRLGEMFVEIGEAYDIEIETLHVASDHVHLLCSFPPRLSISQAVTRLKSLSARGLFREFPALRRRLLGGELWEGGYFVRTVGESLTGATIRRYIERHQADTGGVDENEQDDGQLDLF
jgi:putative transposase